MDEDAQTQARLLGAYVRRKRFEARLIAVEVGRLFAGEKEPERVSESEFWGMMGITMPESYAS